MGIHLETDTLEGVKGLPVARKKGVPISQQEVRVVIQAARSDDFGVEHANGACGGIARIRRPTESLLLALVVHAMECLDRHYDFAAHFKVGGYACRSQLLG